ncbi:MAG: gene transfer agent family protein [Aliihoeflea sp.]|uniref:gene transfer agent family protein n=1 Tax=Aliihoeflea sp. 40Bstr573 TaxID=2696467 RepID=UPI0020963D87|nr:gene transfer agent family protein [Aliihoeflea sp. 40Bstr573]MCO6388630.1 gene transfer agent family protein [Aliihoeflea sp. 40Bstr573]
MNVNQRRGEISATLDGRAFRLCLTLGALAELESAFEAKDLGALVERFSTGRLSAGDMAKIIGAGLRGGGNSVCDGDVLAMHCEDGVTGFAAIVSDLLTASFGVQGGAGEEARPTNP